MTTLSEIDSIGTHTGWVSLRDIAERSGLSRSTVSLALRNRRGVAPATLALVQQLAHELGYRPTPLLSTISQPRRWQRLRDKPLSEIAVISFVQSAPGSSVQGPNLARLVDAGQTFAAARGYRLVVHELAPDAEAPERLGRRLHARGCETAIVMPVRRADFGERFPWSLFSSVALVTGDTVGPVPVHELAVDPFGRMDRVWRELEASGYRRPGLVLDADSAGSVESRWIHGAWLRAQEAAGRGVARLRTHFTGQETPVALRSWIEAERPDVIVGGSGSVARSVKTAGCRCPEDVGYIGLNVAENSDETGFVGTESALLRAAVAHLEREERLLAIGLPSAKQIIHIEAPWRAGTTLRAARPVENAAAYAAISA